jgi:CRISPR-associated protein Cmr2
MSRHLLLWTLAGVQPFIEAARKTQDLWIGSYLLSQLMEAALEPVVSRAEQLIYPAQTTMLPDSYIADLPNKLVAICPTEATKTIAEQARQAVYARWNMVQQRVWSSLSTQVADIAPTKNQWDAQTDPDALFEVYWVAVPYDDTHYGACYQRLEAAMWARKQTRTFTQYQYQQQGEKSTITGTELALQPPGSTRQQVRALWAAVGKVYGNKFIRVDGGERLSAIDAVKRLAASKQGAGPYPLKVDFNRFPSTSTIAAAPFVAAMLTHADQVSSELVAWRSRLHQFVGQTTLVNDSHADVLPYLKQRCTQQTEKTPWTSIHTGHDPRQFLLKQDGDTLFAATYTRKRLERDHGLALSDDPQARATLEEQCRETVAALNDLIDEVRKAATDTRTSTDANATAEPASPAAQYREAVAPPNPYFAVLQMDGDHMGNTIRALDDVEGHKQLSRALSTFARSIVPELVEYQHLARLVYAGGDDVTALAPAAAVLTLADALRASFAIHMGSAMEVTMSASAGIAIAHHQDPLGRTVHAARAAIDAAKEQYGRAALVVTLLRRSGEQTSVGLPWTDAGGRSLVPILEVVVQHYRTGRLSPKLGHVLLTEAPILAVLPLVAQQAELKRLLTRQRASPEALPDNEVASLAADLMVVVQAIEQRTGTIQNAPLELRTPGPRRGIVELGGWLSLLAFLVRGDRT